MKNIKMRVNDDKNSICNFCSEKWKNVPEMYDISLVGNIFTICKSCSDELFQKILKADCMYSGKIKSDEDMQRVRNYEKIHGHSAYISGFKIK